ncbi:amino acid adenylation domain-containing protein [Paenibacillus sp. Mc5Re-14]|uniref:amino acid adenylation domain-containing protein n=1 Tax=Paenibacillus sp. Mc5Re-14 TaxID=1030529 RepID=UPI000A47C741|nr:amino acid adenylation domain-containing protein [Paenibacillus sp. Mc5Re-14]
MNMLQADEQSEKRCLHELVEEQVQRTPCATALLFNGQTLSFAELNERANRTAWYLRGIGVGPDSIVGVFMERSLEMVVALLGILKAGGAYLPLDCESPGERLAFMLEDAGVSVVFTQDKHAHKLSGFDGTVVCLDSEWKSMEDERGDNPDGLAAPGNLAYVIYTSGSTGKPKGCMLPHRAVCNRLLWMQRQYRLNDGDRVLQKTPFTFDVSVWEFFWPLLSGACLVLAKPDGHKDSDYLVRLIQQEQLTVCHFVPSMLRFFLQNSSVLHCRTLRHVFTSGEALPFELVAAFKQKLCARLHNLYGPTEAAIDVTYWECEEREDRKVPIGRPIDNIELHILDHALRPAAEGELYIGGIGLAKGYLNQRELTAASFIPDPFSGVEGARIYKTGDRVRYLADGMVEYLGRIDFQVKLRGNRVELGEIEAVLRQHDAVADAAAMVRDEESGDPKLIAYVEPCGVWPDVKEIRLFAKSKLPGYMVPNRIVYMKALPVTAHGKLDRKALPWPVDTSDFPAESSARHAEAAVDGAAWLADITAGLLEEMKQLLKTDQLRADDDLFDNGATSLTMVQVGENLNRQYGIAVPIEIFLDEPTVAAIAGYISRTGNFPNKSPQALNRGEIDGATGSIAAPSLCLGPSVGRAPAETSESKVLRELTAYLADALYLKEILPRDDLFDQGATSLTMVQIVENIQGRYGVAVPVDLFLDEPNLAAVSAYVAQRIAPGHGEGELPRIHAAEVEIQETQTLNATDTTDNGAITELSLASFNPSAYSQGETARRFASSKIPFRSFSRMISWLGACEEADGGKYKYHYPSAGGLNAIQTYIFVKEQAVEGLQGGLYYFHSERHVLALINGRFELERAAFMPRDRTVVDTAGFALFFIAQMDAIVPIYQMGSQVLATVEAGYMAQLLVSRQQDCGLGVYPVTGLDFGAIREGMHLNQGHRFLHCILGGVPDPAADSGQMQTLAEYLRGTGETSTTHFTDAANEGAYAECLDIESISQWDQLQIMSPKEHFRFMAKRLHLREIAGEATVPLERMPSANGRYEMRACQRNYQIGPVPLERLGKLLTLFRPQTAEGTDRYLSADAAGIRAVSIYLYAKEGGIENLEEGIYRYDAAAHSLIRMSSATEGFVKQIHTPFNRKHFQSSAFNLFMIGRLGDLEPVFKGESLYYALLEAGYMGQLLMERQAEFGIGVCPIGGLKFERVRVGFKLGDKDVMLHSFTCGKVNQALPAGWKRLEDRPSLSQVSPERMPLALKRKVIQHDLAIIGLSGSYPGAHSLEEYWELLRGGNSAISPLPDERRKLWTASRPAAPYNGSKGGYLEHIDCFDSLLFHISPGEARTMDPQERLVLEAAWDCLSHAGYTAEGLSRTAGSIGVFMGAMWSDYQNRGSGPSGDSPMEQPMAFHSSIANRVSYYFNLDGPSIAVNTSCSSAATAIHLACESIKRGECDAALVGGVNLMTDEYHELLLKSIDFLSKDGEGRPFSAQASGWLAGEGVGVMLIRPVEDAERDRDNILGVIKGTSISHTGRTMRFGAPNASAMAASMRKALNNAGVEASSISYIEAAAAGAGMADAAEMQAISEVFGNIKRSEGPCRVGSIKGNIGHLESASAMSQITKVLLQMQHGQLAPTLHCLPLNPLAAWKADEITVADELADWKSNDERPLRALVSAYGATGSGSHVVLEAYRSAPEAGGAKRETGPLVIPLSAASAEQLDLSVARLSDWLGERETVALSDIAYTLQSGREALEERLAIVAVSVSELRNKLQQYNRGEGNVAGLYRGSAGTRSKPRKIDGADPVTAAKRWVRGDLVNWDFLQQGTERKLPMPGYPFARISHWLDDKPSVVMEVSASAEAEALRSPEGDTSAAGHLLPGLEGYLLGIFAEISEIPEDRLNMNTPLENYGIHSMMITRLNGRLGRDFEECPKTLFFECRTLREAAQYLCSTYPVQARKLLGIGPAQPGDEAAAFQAPGNCKPRGMQTLCPPDVGSGPVPAGNLRCVAIVGMDGRYPQAETLDEYWQNLQQGIDCITEIPAERWDYRPHFDPGQRTPGKMYSKWGGFMADADAFDPLFFNISPKEAEIMDPQERLFLQTVWHTFENAGYSREAMQRAFGGRVGVFVGVMYAEYQLYNAVRHEDEDADPVSVVSAYGSIANRISYFFDFHGPSMAVDTLCSSSLTALHLAVESIKRGECEAAVVGGVNLSLHPAKYLMHSQMSMSSTDGRCRSFGEGGNGFVPGEGVGAVLLKPLDKAVADGDHIYGVIKGTAVNHGGKTNGYTVPDPVAQSELILAGLRQAEVDARTVSYVEAHGTGTLLGDPIEIAGLTRSFRMFTGENQFCPLGSVKSNIGHLEAAAGIAGLTKVLLQMRHRQLVPSLHAKHLNPNIDFTQTPFMVQQELAEWRQPELEQDGKTIVYPRRALVSSFGAGGANATVVLEEYAAPLRPLPEETVSRQLFVLSAKSGEQLQEYARRLLQTVHRTNEASKTSMSLQQMAYTLQTGREPLEERLAIVAGSFAELAGKLEQVSDGKETVSDVYRGQANTRRESMHLFAEDEDMRSTVEAWLRKGKHGKLAELWVRGVPLEWRLLYTDGLPSKVPLPGYPFANERYWLPGSRNAFAASESVAAANRLPAAMDLAEPTAMQEDAPAILEEVWAEREIEYSPEATDAVWRTVVFLLTSADSQRVVLDTMRSLAPQIKVIIVAADHALQSGPTAYIVDEVSSQGFGTALQAVHSDHGPVDAVVCVWPVEAREQLRNIAGLSYAVQGIAASGLRPRRLYCASSAIDGLDRCYTEGWIGFIRSLSLALPHTRSAVIGCEAAGGTADTMDRWLALLWTEMQGAKTESVIYRGGERYAACLKTAAAPLDGRMLKSGGTYLITGGLGGLGLLLARHMAMKHPVNLILAGRSPLDDHKRSQISELEELGSLVYYAQTDITDAKWFKIEIQKARNRFGRIDGMIHAAGVLGEEDILGRTAESLQEELAPKIDGTLVLDEVLGDEPLDFICYFSSVAAVLGDFGSCSYAAGSRFQLAYASYRNGLRQNAMRHGKAVAILWPLWREGGMHAGNAAKEERYLQYSGLRYLETDEGLSLYDQLLSTSGSHSIVLPGRPERIRELTVTAGETSREVPLHLNSPGHAAEPERGLELFIKNELKQQISRILKIPCDKLSYEESFSGFGFDSISLIDLARGLSDRFGIEIMPPLFYNHSTIAAVGNYLLLEHGESMLRNYAETVAGGVEPTSVPSQPGNRTEAAGVSLRPLDAKGSVEGASTADDRPALAAEGIPQELEAIAIIGMSGQFPMARNIEEMWEILKAGREAVQEIPGERWEWRSIAGDPILEVGTTNCNRGGFVPGAAEFDPGFFDISRREAELMDPRGRLLLQETWNALEDAGYGPNQIASGTVGMFVGLEQGDYALLAAGRGNITSHSNAVLASRLAYFLNLDGPVMAIDTACSSALVAVHQACMSLRNRESDTAVAAGATVIAAQETYVGMSQAGMLSDDGKCFAFDQRANGLVPGEAAAAIILKRLADAEADGDPIYAVIRGSGINYDGKTNGITAPNGAAQSKLLRTVYKRYGIQPEEIEVVAAHGTGTKLGDPVEFNALCDAFKTYTSREQYCAIISNKTNFGHTLGTSGLVSLIGMVQSLRFECIPATLNCEQDNEYIRWERSPFYLNKTAKPWPSRTGKRRLGAVSAFGMSGTNAHVVVEGYEKRREPVEAGTPAYLLLLSAKSEAALEGKIADLLAVLQHGGKETPDLAELSRTLMEGRFHFLYRCAVVVRNCEEAVSALLQSGSQSQPSGLYMDVVQREFSGTQDIARYGEELLEQSRSQLKRPELYYETLLSLAELYCQGYDLVWSRLFMNCGVRRAHAPGYPFARERYWLSRIIQRPLGMLQPESAAPSLVRRAAENIPLQANRQPAETTMRKDIPAGHKLAALVEPETVDVPAEAAASLSAAARKRGKIALRPLSGLIPEQNEAFERTKPFVSLTPVSKSPDGVRPAGLKTALELPALMPMPVAPSGEETEALAVELCTSLGEALFMEPDLVEADRPFIELGMDSIVGVEWIRSVNKHYGTAIAATRIYDYPTVRMFAGFLAKERRRLKNEVPAANRQASTQLDTDVHTASIADPEDHLLEELTVSLAEALFLEREAVSPTRPFIELGMDSIVGVEWIRSVNNRYGTAIAATKVYDYPTVRMFAGFLAKERRRLENEVPAADRQASTQLGTDVHTAPVADPADHLLEELTVSLAEALFLEREAVSPTRPFIELGMDSIVGVEWVRSVNKRFGTQIAATKIYDYPNLAEFTAYVAREHGKACPPAEGKLVGLGKRTDPPTLDEVLELLYRGEIELAEANQLYQFIQEKGTAK